MNYINELAIITKKIKTITWEYQHAHAKWAKWLYWAKKQVWFDDWAYDNAMRPSDLKAEKRFISKKHANAEPTYDQDEGTPLYALRHMLYSQLDELRLRRSYLIGRLWFETLETEKWAYDRAQLAVISGMTLRSFDQYIRRQSWYRPRKSAGRYTINKKYIKILEKT